MEGPEEIKSDFAENGHVEDVDRNSQEEYAGEEENMQDFLNKIQKEDDKDNIHLKISMNDNMNN